MWWNHAAFMRTQQQQQQQIHSIHADVYSCGSLTNESENVFECIKGHSTVIPSVHHWIVDWVWTPPKRQRLASTIVKQANKHQTKKKHLKYNYSKKQMVLLVQCWGDHCQGRFEPIHGKSRIVQYNSLTCTFLLNDVVSYWLLNQLSWCLCWYILPYWIQFTTATAECWSGRALYFSLSKQKIPMCRGKIVQNQLKSVVEEEEEV